MDITELEAELGSDFRRILNRYPTGLVNLWGVQPGPQNTPKFQERMRDGTRGIMVGHEGAYLVMTATVVLERRQPVVARALWGEEGGRSWEHMYVVDDKREISVSKPELARMLDYKENYSFQ